MADPNRPLGGFANPNFVLINGEYWSASENRRYVQAHAWIVEFANILLEWMQNSGNRNPRWPDQTPLSVGGPSEIMNYIEYFACYIARGDPTIESKVRGQMYHIRRLRNQITHENIENSETLKTLLSLMKNVCE
jgi:hypothetical protein